MICLYCAGLCGIVAPVDEGSFPLEERRFFGILLRSFKGEPELYRPVSSEF
jgi:hypothetical protein